MIRIYTSAIYRVVLYPGLSHDAVMQVGSILYQWLLLLQSRCFVSVRGTHIAMPTCLCICSYYSVYTQSQYYYIIHDLINEPQLPWLQTAIHHMSLDMLKVKVTQCTVSGITELCQYNNITLEVNAQHHDIIYNHKSSTLILVVGHDVEKIFLPEKQSNDQTNTFHVTIWYANVLVIYVFW